MRTPYWGSTPEEDTTKKEEMTFEKKSSSKASSGVFTSNGMRIYFYKDISSATVAELVPKLKELETLSLKQAIDLEIDPRPIHLHIHSYGGSVFAGLAALDAIKRSKVPIHTHIEGAAASAATFLSTAGSHRTIGPNSYILIHQLSSAFWGKYEEFKDELINYTLLMDKIKEVYETHSKMTSEQLEELLKRDLWLPAAQALEFGLVDEVA